MCILLLALHYVSVRDKVLQRMPVHLACSFGAFASWTANLLLISSLRPLLWNRDYHNNAPILYACNCLIFINPRLSHFLLEAGGSASFILLNANACQNNNPDQTRVAPYWLLHSPEQAPTVAVQLHTISYRFKFSG